MDHVLTLRVREIDRVADADRAARVAVIEIVVAMRVGARAAPANARGRERAAR
jgi:hypothetical protein